MITDLYAGTSASQKHAQEYDHPIDGVQSLQTRGYARSVRITIGLRAPPATNVMVAPGSAVGVHQYTISCERINADIGLGWSIGQQSARV